MNWERFIDWLCIASISGLAIFYAQCYNQLKNDAIQHGVAEYYLDANNNKQFRWKECGE